MRLDALALEYQRDYGTARGDLDIADIVNNPAANGKCRVFGWRPAVQKSRPGFAEFMRRAGSRKNLLLTVTG